MLDHPLSRGTELVVGEICSAHHQLSGPRVEVDGLNDLQSSLCDVGFDHMGGHVPPAEAGIVPTILEATGIKAPDMVNGIKQSPIEDGTMQGSGTKIGTFLLVFTSVVRGPAMTRYVEMEYSGKAASVRTQIDHINGAAMSWFFEGNGQQIGFSVSENGVLSAYGNCSQNCEPGDDWIGIRSRMNSVAASWKICTPASEEHEYDGIGPVGRGLCGKRRESSREN